MLYRLLIFVITVFNASFLHAQSLEERISMVDSLIEYRKSGSSIYQPPPITHMVPNFNTITYAFAFEKRNIEVLPRLPNGDRDTFQDSSLKLTGYTLAPHLAISLKKVGLGLSIENSKNSSEFSFNNRFITQRTRQTTTVSTAGLGFNVSVLPFERLRKNHKLALIAGGKSLNVKHTFTDLVPDSFANKSSFNASYSILKYEMGANLTLALLKEFRVIPWVDYTFTDVKAANAAFKESTGNFVTPGLYSDDIRLYWQSTPNFRYGMDLSIGIFGLDIRIGSTLGKLARFGSGPDYINDSSFNVSLSFDQQGS